MKRVTKIPVIKTVLIEIRNNAVSHTDHWEVIILAIWTIAVFHHTSACGTLEYGENKYYRRTGFQCLADQTFITATFCRCAIVIYRKFNEQHIRVVTAFRKSVDDISVIADNSDVGRRSTHTCVDKMNIGTVAFSICFCKCIGRNFRVTF